uniref:Uncharacterized protein LOC102806842 n=1 Tax=Saccoglossus kowalevskii TaxID=10224 RepID=A0ABM0LZC7_SACKO|nr:PREDICTED: uncharacterized protein LOC102806842 [Saccoglossus kowalevskii]
MVYVLEEEEGKVSIPDMTSSVITMVYIMKEGKVSIPDMTSSVITMVYIMKQGKSPWLAPIYNMFQSGPSVGKEKHILTPGISVETVKLPGIGKCSLWDIAGQSHYYVSHSMFFDADKATFVIVYQIVGYEKTSDGYELIRPMIMKQKSMDQVTFWLKFLRNLSIDHPLILIVASRADWVGQWKHEAEIVVSQILQECLDMIEDDLNILNECFLINCHDVGCPDMQRLRAALCTRRTYVLQNIPRMPRICTQILKTTRKWVAVNIDFPVMDWTRYLGFIRDNVDALVKEDFLKKATNYLHNSGEIIHFKDVAIRGDVIILVSMWLCYRIIGPMLASDEFIQFSNRLPNQEVYTTSEIAEVFEKSFDVPLILHLLEKLELLFLFKPDPEGDTTNNQYIIPTLLPYEMPQEQWEMGDYKNHKGRSIKCHQANDMFLPLLFCKVQTRLYHMFEELGFPPSGIWKNGIKLCHGVEGLVHLTSNKRAIHIIVRGESNQDTGRCYQLIDKVTQCIYAVRNEISPGCNVDQVILSPRSIKMYQDPGKVASYSNDVIHDAVVQNIEVYHKEKGWSEKVEDLLCPGFDPTFLKELQYQCDIKWLLHDTKEELINMLEVEREDSHDHRMMARYMGISNDERRAMARNPERKVTEQLFEKWSSRWAEKTHRDGPKAEKTGNEGPPNHDIYYNESSIENLLLISKKYLETDLMYLKQYTTCLNNLEYNHKEKSIKMILNNNFLEFLKRCRPSLLSRYKLLISFHDK